MTSDVGRARWALLSCLAVTLLTTGCASVGSQTVADVPPTVDEVLAAGDQAARRGDLERALVHYLQAVGIEESAAVWLRVGAASTELEKRDRAVAAYLKAIELDPSSAEAREGAGLELLALGDDAAAREHLSRAVVLEPRRWRSHNALGVIADKAGDYAQAILHYQAALDLEPNSPMLLNNIGYSRFLAGDHDQAARDFYAATQLDPSYEPAWANLGLLYAHRGWYKDAVAILSKVTDKATAHNDVGYIALERGDLKESERLLSEAVRLSPTFYEAAYRNLQAVRSRMQANQALPDESVGFVEPGADPFASLSGG